PAPVRADVIASNLGPGDTFQTSTATAWSIGGNTNGSNAVGFTIPPDHAYRLSAFRFAANWFAGTNTVTADFYVAPTSSASCISCADLNNATLLESFVLSTGTFQTGVILSAVSTTQPLLVPGNVYVIALRLAPPSG